MTGFRKHGVLLLLLVALTGCASSKSAAPQKSSPANEISAAELTKSAFADAFSAVQSLRPQWLSVRGATSLRSGARIRVYLDGSLYGSIDNLRQIPSTSIESIKHLDAIEASNRYGLDHGAGAILVFSKK